MPRGGLKLRTELGLEPENPNGVNTRRRKKRQEIFLKYFREVGIIKYAAKASGTDSKQIAVWRQRYPDFAKAFDEALEDANDVLEGEAFRRAVKGVKRLKIHQGQPVEDPRVRQPTPAERKKGKLPKLYYEREYSDTLLIVMLKSRRPERFKDSSNTTISNKLVLQPIKLDGQPQQGPHPTQDQLKDDVRKQLPPPGTVQRADTSPEPEPDEDIEDDDNQE